MNTLLSYLGKANRGRGPHLRQPGTTAQMSEPEQNTFPDDAQGGATDSLVDSVNRSEGGCRAAKRISLWVSEVKQVVNGCLQRVLWLWK